MSKSLVLAAVAGLLMFGCGSRTVSTKDDTKKLKDNKGSADAGTVLRKAVVISWSTEKRQGIEETDPVTTLVKIAQTIETGAKDHNEVGIVEGVCVEKTVDKAGGPKALLWLYCEWKGKGTQLKLVKDKFDLVVLKGKVDTDADEIAYDEFKRVKLPLGARVTTAPMEK